MKVVVSRISPDTVGGAELSAFDNCVVLKELGHESVLVTNLEPLHEKAKKLGIETYWFPWVNRGPSSLPVIRQIMFILLVPFTWMVGLIIALQTRPDIFNPHSREDQIAFSITKWAHRRPVVWKDPGDLVIQLNPENKGAIKRMYMKLIKYAAKKADHIYSLNPGHVAFVKEVLGSESNTGVSQIPSGILYRNYDRDAEPQTKPEGKLVVGTVVRLEKAKGADMFIEAAKEIGGDKAEFWLLNDQGTDADELIALAKGQDHIKFFPHTDNVSSFYNTFDILVHASDSEGWGRVIKEGMYFGVPVIGSDIDGIRLHITDKENGILFEKRNQSELNSKLKELIDNADLRNSLGSAAKTKAEADGDFVKTVKDQIIPLFSKYAKK